MKRKKSRGRGEGKGGERQSAIQSVNEIFIKGIVSGPIGVTYSKPILSNGKYARIDLSITVSEVDPYDATSVFKNGGFRGVVKSLKRGMNLED